MEAAKARGHQVRVLNPLKFSISLEKEAPELFYRGRRLSTYDAVIPRIGASITFYGTALVRQFEQMGVYCLNAANGISAARDKLRSLQVLSRHDIGIPGTAFARDRSDILPAIERVGGVPVVIKVLEGTQGIGVILAETITVAEAIIETLQSARQNVLIQKFVAESMGRDIRALVVGDRVVAAMRRVAQGMEFRSNVHRGGRAQPVTLERPYQRTAVRAAQITGLRVAGVDMLESELGPQVMEVNSSPGLEGIETATGIDVAGTIIEYLEDHVKFPEVDVRQRLSQRAGYGVAEVPVADGSELAGATLGASRLRDRDIVVLSIQRGDEVIANPKGERRLDVGDRLLCFGRLSAMRDLIPQRPRKPRKKARGRARPAPAG